MSQSVTTWIGRLKAGDHAAAQQLWQRYFQQIVQLARAKLRHASRAVADEEDAALNAFDSFWRGVQDNRFPRLEDRDDLWQLLVMLTARKAADQVKWERRRKRGGGKVAHASAVPGDDLAEVLGESPSPAFAAQVAEEYQRLLAALDDPQLRAVAQAKMEGYSNDEIAAQVCRACSTVERKLRRIRDQWSKELEGPP